jgi:hypothetical protein
MNQSSDLREENPRLRKAVEELSTLNELACAIGSTQSVESIIAPVVNRSCWQFTLGRVIYFICYMMRGFGIDKNDVLFVIQKLLITYI